MVGFPSIISSLLIRSFQNRDDVRNEIAGKRWISRAADEVAEALLPLTHHHSAAEDFEEELCVFFLALPWLMT